MTGSFEQVKSLNIDYVFDFNTGLKYEMKERVSVWDNFNNSMFDIINVEQLKRKKIANLSVNLVSCFSAARGREIIRSFGERFKGSGIRVKLSLTNGFVYSRSHPVSFDGNTYAEAKKMYGSRVTDEQYEKMTLASDCSVNKKDRAIEYRNGYFATANESEEGRFYVGSGLAKIGKVLMLQNKGDKEAMHSTKELSKSQKRRYNRKKQKK